MLRLNCSRGIFQLCGVCLEDRGERGGSPARPGRSSAVNAAASAAVSVSAAEDDLERAAEVDVEDGIEDRIQRRVGVAQPEEEREQRPRHGAGG